MTRAALLALALVVALLGLAAPAHAQVQPGTLAWALQGASSNCWLKPGQPPRACIPTYVEATARYETGPPWGPSSRMNAAINSVAAMGVTFQFSLGTFWPSAGPSGFDWGAQNQFAQAIDALDITGTRHAINGVPRPQYFTVGFFDAIGGNTPSWMYAAPYGVNGTGVPAAVILQSKGTACPTYNMAIAVDGWNVPATDPRWPNTFLGLNSIAFAKEISLLKSRNFPGTFTMEYNYLTAITMAVDAANGNEDSELGPGSFACSAPGSTTTGTLAGTLTNIQGQYFPVTYLSATNLNGLTIKKGDYILLPDGVTYDQFDVFCTTTGCGNGTNTGLYPLTSLLSNLSGSSFSYFTNVSKWTKYQTELAKDSVTIESYPVGYIVGTTLTVDHFGTGGLNGTLAIGDQVTAPNMVPQQITAGSGSSWTVTPGASMGSPNYFVTFTAGQDLMCPGAITTAFSRSMHDLAAQLQAAGPNNKGQIPLIRINTTNGAGPYRTWDCQPSSTNPDPPVDVSRQMLQSIGDIGPQVANRLHGGGVNYPQGPAGATASAEVIEYNNTYNGWVFAQNNANSSYPCGGGSSLSQGVLQTTPDQMAEITAFQGGSQLYKPWLLAWAEVPSTSYGQAAPCIDSTWPVNQPAYLDGYVPNYPPCSAATVAGQTCTAGSGALQLFGGAATSATEYQPCNGQLDGLACYGLDNYIELAGGIPSPITFFLACSASSPGWECYGPDAKVYIKQ